MEKGLVFKRRLTTGQGRPDAAFEWARRRVKVMDEAGKAVVFEGEVEAPTAWSDLAVMVAVRLYLRVVGGRREDSIRAMIYRVVEAIVEASRYPDVGRDYFASESDRVVFGQELFHILAGQYAAFNTPVWINVGVTTPKHEAYREQPRRGKRAGGNAPAFPLAAGAFGAYPTAPPNAGPQASACFIQGLRDDMRSILDLQASEVMLFRGGSGTGTNFSVLRPKDAPLSCGGTSSGPVSFMRGFDANAGVTKSGGKSRRAAKMVSFDVYHPDVVEFVDCKSEAQGMIRALGRAGYDMDFNGRATTWMPYQNANQSVRVDDAFMTAVQAGTSVRLHWPTQWSETKFVGDEATPVAGAQISGAVVDARQLLRRIAERARDCGDPGLQFHDEIQRWHTSVAAGPINASNPCQTAFAPLLTPKGITTLGQVDVGSVIWSGEAWTKIVRKIATGRKEVFRFHTRAGSFLGTEDHKVFSHGARVAAKNAIEIDVAVGPREKVTAPPLAAQNPQDVLDGLMLGDGTVVHANDGANDYLLLCIGAQDSDYWASEVAPLITRQPFDVLRHRASTTLTPAELPKTYARRIPDRFFYAPPLRAAAFLRGLFSANGSIAGGRITLKASSFEVIDRVQQMLSSLGIRSYYTTNKAHDVEFKNGTYTCRESYDLNIGVRDDKIRFRDLIGFIHADKTRRLDAACARPAGRPAKQTYEVVSRESLGVHDVFDIEVEHASHAYWTGGLKVSNCSEFMYIDDSACNLASLRLTKFFGENGFDCDLFAHVARTMFAAQEILVSASGFPTDAIAKNSRDFRPLGLGYADLGALVMRLGLPYDSDRARGLGAALTSLLCGVAYDTSAEMARLCGGPFPRYAEVRADMLRVVELHRAHARKLAIARRASWLPEDMGSAETPIDAVGPIADAAAAAWCSAHAAGVEHGFRNAQATVLAPTGSIGFLMDCDTTGIEPDTYLKKRKKLAGGGVVEFASESIAPALRRLKYDEAAVEAITAFVKENGRLPRRGDDCRFWVMDCDAAVFATAYDAPAISIDGHLGMMSAAQPFLSGAISKTVGMPAGSSAEDVERAFVRAWRLGLKAIAVYVDGSKDQPLSSAAKTPSGAQDASKPAEAPAVQPDASVAPAFDLRVAASASPPTDPRDLEIASLRAELAGRRLPDDVRSLRHKFRLGGVACFMHVGFREDGTIGEIFVKLPPRAPNHLVVDLATKAASQALQRGADAADISGDWIGADFEPRGFTGQGKDGIPWASSPLDYVARWIRKRSDGSGVEVAASSAPSGGLAVDSAGRVGSDRPACPRCKSPMVQAGACLSCPTCGHGEGGCGGG